MTKTSPSFRVCAFRTMVFGPIAWFFALSSTVGAAHPSDAEIWASEKAYWEYVQANDLEKYRTLWHKDFVGWPSVSPNPLGKSHITDWITNQTSKGLKLQSYSIEPLAVCVTGNIAIDHYRIRTTWAKVGSAEVGAPETTRITHTWIKINDRWQILGGMSAPVNADGK